MSSRLDSLEPMVAAAAAGDRTAFAALVSETSSVVSSIALAILRDLDLSRDVSQDVFLAAWRDLRRLRNPASFLPWLRQMTRNRAHHVLRTHARRTRRNSSGDAEATLAGVADPRPDPYARLIDAEDRAALAEALAALPDETREVLMLYYREGQSTAQVAALLDLDEAAVRKRLSRARGALKATLLDRAANTAAETRPTDAFTAVVLAALPLSATTAGPATAAAAANTAWKAGLLAKAMAVCGGAIAGAAGGMVGVFFGSRRLLREARDDEERRGLRRFTIASVAAVLTCAVMFPVSATLPHPDLAAAINFGAFMATLAILHHVWLPRIVGRRLEMEMREDPERALRRRRAERRASIVGWTIGGTLGTLGLLLGIHLN